MTLEAFAQEAGVSTSAVSLWLTKTKRMDPDNLDAVARLTGEPAENLQRMVYGGRTPLAELPTALPPEWLAAVRAEIAAGVADGLAQVLEMLRSEGLLPAADTQPQRQPRRRSA